MVFEGAITAMVSPLDKNGDVDEKGLRKNVEFQIKEGIQGLVPMGTTGECATLSYEEHNRVVDIVVDAVKGRVPVIAGTGSNSTWETIMLTRHAKEAGADGALLVCPYYNRPTQPGLYAHYKKVAEEVDIPIVIYNIPSRTGVNMTPETMARLAKLKNIVGVKEATGDMDQVARIIELTKEEDFVVTSGNDSDTVEIMKMGGVGVISVASNIAPKKVVELVDLLAAKDYEKAEKLERELAELFSIIFIETNPGPIKAAMDMMGLPAGPLRLPMVDLEPKNREKLREFLVKAGMVK